LFENRGYLLEIQSVGRDVTEYKKTKGALKAKKFERPTSMVR
jgi:hypothetical protein